VTGAIYRKLKTRKGFVELVTMPVADAIGREFSDNPSKDCYRMVSKDAVVVLEENFRAYATGRVWTESMIKGRLFHAVEERDLARVREIAERLIGG